MFIAVVLTLLYFIDSSGKRADSASNSLGIILNFMQMMSLLASINLGWPSGLGGMLSVFGLSTFNTDALAAECAAQMSPAARLVSRLLTPVYGLLILVVVFVVVKVLRSIGRVRSDHLGDVNRFIGAGIMVYHVLFTLLSQAILEAFSCVRLSDGTWALQGSPDTKCFQSEWNSTVLPAAVIGILVYLVAIPSCLAWYMWRCSKQGLLKEPKVRLHIGLLYIDYKRDRAWWVVVDYLRKLAAAIAVTVVTSDPIVRSVVMMMVLAVTILATEHLAPFKDKPLATFDQMSSLVTGLALMAGISMRDNGGEEQFYNGSARQACSVLVILFVVASLGVMTVYALKELIQEARKHYRRRKGKKYLEPAEDADSRAVTPRVGWKTDDAVTDNQPVTHAIHSFPLNETSETQNNHSNNSDGTPLSPLQTTVIADQPSPSTSAAAESVPGEVRSDADINRTS